MNANTKKLRSVRYEIRLHRLGNMAGAIIAGMAACGKFKNDYLYGFNRSQGKTLALKEKHGLIPCASAAEVAEKADVIILAVKPQVLPEVMPEIVKGVTKDKTVISIAAGKSIGWYEERLAKGVPVVRCMPNINAKVKASVTAICGGKGRDGRRYKNRRRHFCVRRQDISH